MKLKATVAGGIPLRPAGNLIDTMTVVRQHLHRGITVWVRDLDDGPGRVVEFKPSDLDDITCTTYNIFGDPTDNQPDWVAKAHRYLTSP